MKTAKIVIGLGFGDEGKGITTDFLAKQNPESIVIRFSGGQQAAHTVMIGNRKHVHSSFASGALRGLPSYYSEHCTIHPLFLYNEREELKEKNANLDLYIHPLAKVTTPFDVWHNRGNVRNIENGTCGKGIGSTMKRNEGPYKLFAIDLIAPREMLLEKLNQIAYYYGFLNESGIEEEINAYLEAIDKLKWNIVDYTFLSKYENLIFEGTEGLPLQIARELQKRQLSLTLSEQFTGGLVALQLSRVGAPLLASEVVPSQEETLAQTAHWTSERRGKHYAGLALAISGLENDHLNFALATPDGTFALRVHFSVTRHSLLVRQEVCAMMALNMLRRWFNEQDIASEHGWIDVVESLTL